MASDGSQPLDWSGKAFSYLLHHNNFIQTETYANPKPSSSSLYNTHHPSSTTTARDRTGTWNGPAPQGYTNQPTHAKDEDANHLATTTTTTTTTERQPEHVTLPGGAAMPLIGLGTYKLDDPDAVSYALSVGYRHIDCARSYGNENIIGQGIATYIQNTLSDSNNTTTATEEEIRKSLWITSKIWNDAHRADAVHASVDQTLKDLRTPYLDLLLIHWPEAWLPGTQDIDTGVTIAETWQAMESLVDQGKVRYIGVSNFSLKEIEELISIARIKPVVNQIELHPLLAQRKMVGVCMRKGVTCVGYSPLGHSKSDLLEHPIVVKIAQELNKSPAQVLLRWNVQRGVPVIPKASSREHVKDNIDGLFSWRLQWNHKAELDRLDEGKRLCIADWHVWEDVEEGGAVKPSTVLL